MKVAGPETAMDTPAPETAEIALLEGELEQFERELRELNTNDENLKRQELELIELRAILSNTGTFFEEVRSFVCGFVGTRGIGGVFFTHSLFLPQADAHGSHFGGHDGDHDTPLLGAPDQDRSSQLGCADNSL